MNKDNDNIGNVIESQSVITIQCSKQQKASFVKAAMPKKLNEWIISTLTKAVEKSDD